MLEVAIAPEGALVRVSQAINRPKRRSLGIFKMENEFVGVVADGGFEIWERGQRAVHARAQVRARRGGTRIELRFLLPVYTRVLVVLFFVLYAAVAAGIALLPPDRSLSIDELLLTHLRTSRHAFSTNAIVPSRTSALANRRGWTILSSSMTASNAGPRPALRLSARRPLPIP